jgi:sec-independent protein translocase protein TatA
MIGVWQLILILLIMLAIFGSGKLPQVAKDIGKGIKALREESKKDNKDNDN